MNKIYSLPKEVCIDGISYAVNTDFRIWIEIGNIILDKDFNLFSKIEKILKLAYKEKLPPTLERSIEGILYFYRGEKLKKTVSDNDSGIAVVDFLEDSDMIAAAFYHDYGLNLWEAEIHWWQFKALFLALHEENKIMKVIKYRAVDLGDIKDKEQKRFYKKMKNLYKLEDKRTPEEKERDMFKKLYKAFEEVDLWQTEV